VLRINASIPLADFVCNSTSSYERRRYMRLVNIAHWIYIQEILKEYEMPFTSYYNLLRTI
jgi:hypothetical protein